MSRIDMNGKWQLKGISPDGDSFELAADVPGSTLGAVLNSEIEKGLDVFYRDNADKVQKYERYNWIYSKSFGINDADKKYMLVFEKLDTYCDVYINDKHIASCDNGYIPHRFDISKWVKKGENIVTVYFYSPVTRVLGKKELPGAFTVERLHTRRMQCTYGWDWVMRFVTCTVGNVYLEDIDEGMHVEKAYVYTKSIDEDSAEIVIDIDFKNYECGGIVDIGIIDGDGKLVKRYSRYNEENFMRINLDVEAPKLWYPNGYGDAELYRLEIRLRDKLLYNTQFGIRTVKIMELSDKEGSENYNKCIELKKTPFSEHYDKNDEFSGFILKINGERIMCKGANWVPCEPFANSNTDKKVTKLLELAKAAGVNMLRVWGGGDIETEHFYNECSRLGIMVTQDFLMACGQYPEDDSYFLEQLKKEAQYAVDMLRNKACLVWWSGDNENAINGCDTDTDYKGRASAYKAIAPVIYKNDYNRRFLASSPYGGNFYASNTKGTTHNTQFLEELFPYMQREDVSDYKDYFKLYNARFIAEEPVLGAASEECLKRFMTEEDIYGEDLSMWLYHTRSNPALSTQVFEYMYSFAQGMLGKFKNGEDRLFKLKYLQYEWLRVSLERVRREKWFCSGVVYWMLNDCWPAAAGWSLIDYYGEPKAGYYAFKRTAKPVIVSVDKEDKQYKIHICNDGGEQELCLQWYAVSEDGAVVYKSDSKKICSEKNTSFVALEINEEEVPEGCFVVADIDNDRAFYKQGMLEIIPASDRINITGEDDESISIRADAYVHAVELGGNAIFEDNYFSMLPGEEKIVKFTKSGQGIIKANAYTFK